MRESIEYIRRLRGVSIVGMSSHPLSEGDLREREFEKGTG